MVKTRRPRARPATARRAARPPNLKLRTLTPYLAFRDAKEAIAWYRKAFGAKELVRMPTPDGKLMHAELQIGDSRLMVSDIFAESDLKDPRDAGATTVNLHLYHKDVDRLWQRAVDAGAQVAMPLENQFWGDRYGKLRDPFGHVWSLAFRARMSKQELDRKRKEAMEAMATGQQPTAAVS